MDNPSTLRKWAATFVGLTGFLAVIYEFRSDIDAVVQLPAMVDAYGILFVLTPALIALAFFILSILQSPISNFANASVVPTLIFEPAQLSDLTLIDSLSTEAFGTVASNISQIEKLYETSKEIFWKVTDTSKGRIVAYFCIYSLTPTGCNQILNGTFNAPCPDPSAIRVRNRKKSPVYVGAIFGKGLKAKGVAIAGLSMLLQQIQPTCIYARAASKDGLRLLLKNHFVPVDQACAGIGMFYYRASQFPK